MINVKKLIIKLMGKLSVIDERILLWENDNPTATFAAQTISDALSEKPGSFDEIEVLWAANTTNAAAGGWHGTDKMLVTSNNAIEFITNLSSSSAGSIRCRYCEITADSIVFAGCYSKSNLADSSATLGNTYIIPLKIYGVRYGRT